MAYESGNWMWAEACELIDRAERLQRQFFQVSRSRTRQPAWEPPADVFETEGELWVLVALPGVQPERIQVGIDAGTLVVAGERALPRVSRALIHRLEIPHGQFERRIELPAGRFELGQREVVNGCLLLALRKL